MSCVPPAPKRVTRNGHFGGRVALLVIFKLACEPAVGCAADTSRCRPADCLRDSVLITTLNTRNMGVRVNALALARVEENDHVPPPVTNEPLDRSNGAVPFHLRKSLLEGRDGDGQSAVIQRVPSSAAEGRRGKPRRPSTFPHPL